MPKVSIIITNYNGKEYLNDCIKSLRNSTFLDFEIIIVDNGSSDGSVDFLKENFPEIQVVALQKNLGLSISSNRGRKLAKGKYLFFYNNDTIADKRMLEQLFKTMEDEADVGICGCKIMTYDGKSLINAGVPIDIFGYPFGEGEPFYVDAAIFIRTDLFDRMGGFDERMFLYGEDRDLCWRCWLYGFKVKVVETAIFFHDSACIDSDLKKYKTNIFKRYNSEFNYWRSVLKNYSLPRLIFIAPSMFLVNLGEILVFSLKGQFEVVQKVYFKAILDNLKLFKEMLDLRIKVQRERKINDRELMRHMQWKLGKFLLFKRMGVPQFE